MLENQTHTFTPSWFHLRIYELFFLNRNLSVAADLVSDAAASTTCSIHMK